MGLEEALRVRLDFILFTGFEVETEVRSLDPLSIQEYSHRPGIGQGSF